MMKSSYQVLMSMGLVFFCTTVVSCHTLNIAAEPVSIFNNKENTEGVAKIGTDLYLSQLRLSPWIARTPDCDSCKVEVKQIDRPSGASRVISISENNKIVWMFVDSRARRISAPMGTFFINPTNQLVFSNAENNIEVELHGQVSIKQCEIYYLWLNHDFETTENISNENPDVHFQALVDCQ